MVLAPGTIEIARPGTHGQCFAARPEMKERLLLDGVGRHAGYVPIHQRIKLSAHVLPRLAESKLTSTYLAMSLTGIALDSAAFKLLV